MRFVVDSGPLVAASDRRDVAHRLALAAMTRGEPELLVTDPVVTEVDHLLRRRVSSAAARAFLEDVRTETYRRVQLDTALFDRAVGYDRLHADLRLGIADSSVMALAESLRAPILTFDFAHFRAAAPFRGGFWRLVIDEDVFNEWLSR